MRLIIANRIYSSWSLRPWIAMKQFDLPFDETLVLLRQETSKANILAHSPSGKVPALIDDGVTVWDSLAIMEYLADKFPDKAVWPRDRLARAHARCISAEMHSGFQELRKACGMDVTKRFAARPRSDAVMADVKRVDVIWTEARTRFGTAAGGAFLFGTFSAADAMYLPVATRMRTWNLPLSPASQAYADALLALPAFIEWRTAAAAEPWVLDNLDQDETVLEDLRAGRS